MLPKVSIIVLNYNGIKFLDACFSSLSEITYPYVEIIMVDNASTDDSVEYVKNRYPFVKIIPSGGNYGFAYGNNVGIKESDGDYVLLLNNDIIATPEFLTRLVNVMESDKKIGVVSGWPLQKEYWHLRDKLKENKVLQYSTICGAMMLIRRDIIDEVELLDEEIFLYWEDSDFCYRVNLAGYKVVCTYDSFICHLTNQTGLPTKKKWMREFVKNKIYIHLKLMPTYYLFPFLFAEAIRSVGRIFIHPTMTSAIISAWIWNIEALQNGLLEKRKEIRLRKKISDMKLLRLIYSDYKVNKKDKAKITRLNDKKI